MVGGVFRQLWGPTLEAGGAARRCNRSVGQLRHDSTCCTCTVGISYCRLLCCRAGRRGTTTRLSAATSTVVSRFAFAPPRRTAADEHGLFAPPRHMRYSCMSRRAMPRLRAASAHTRDVMIVRMLRRNLRVVLHVHLNCTEPCVPVGGRIAFGALQYSSSGRTINVKQW